MFTVQMRLERETKGAVRYLEAKADGSPVVLLSEAKIGTLYIRKSAFAGKAPERITVEVR